MPDDKKVEDAKNPTAKATMDSITAELEIATRKILEKDALIDDLTLQLQEANNILTAQQKSKLIKEIVPHSKIPVDQLQAKTVAELQQIKIAVDSATPSSPNIHFDALSEDRNKRSPLGDLYGKKQGEN